MIDNTTNAGGAYFSPTSNSLATAPQPVAASISDNLLASLRLEILSGQIAPGARLIEGAIAERYAISRGPVRTALSALEARGLLTREARRVTRVIDLATIDTEALYSFRVALEVYAVDALKRRDSFTLDQLEKAASDLAMILSTDTPPHIRAIADVKFHTILISLPQDGYLTKAWNTLQDRLILIVARIQRTTIDRDVLLKYHLDIVNALRGRDWKAATIAVRSHARMALNAISWNSLNLRNEI